MATDGSDGPHGPAGQGWLRRLDRPMGLLVEGPAALLVVAEAAILLTGVLARYVFHAPLVWTDELASMLFLWLAMLGAVLAFRRAEHMRMTALIAKARPAARAGLDTLALAASLAFLVLAIMPAINFVSEEAIVTTPAMEISNAWRAAALPTGLGLMIASALVQLAARVDWRWTLSSLVLCALVIGGLALAQPVLRPLGNYNLLIFFVGVVAALVFAGVPIAFAFGLSSFGYIAVATRLPTEVLIGRMDEGMSHLILLAVPMFVFLGLLIEMTGMARAMVGFLASMLAHVRGGLQYVLIGAMYLVSGISGAKAADMAAVAPALFPEMKARGAKEGDLVALLAATGAQTETIPPSIVLITIGSVTGVSISALFTGGLLPGFVLGTMLCIVVWRRYRGEDLSHVVRPGAKAIGRALLVAMPALGLPFVIRAAVVEGVATATEVSTIGIVYAVLVGVLVYREFDVRRLYPMLVTTAALSGAILLIIGAATGMAWLLIQSGFSRTLAAAMTGLPGGGPMFLIVSAIAFVVLGSVLEGIPAIVLFGPLLFPIARQVGVHEVQYAMVVILAMGLGLFAPPFGVGYYAACAISRVNPDAGMRPIVGYMLALVAGIALIIAFPWLSLGFL